MCDWFLRCENSPAGVVAHPVLGEVETCERCAAKLDLDLKPLPKSGRAS